MERALLRFDGFLGNNVGGIPFGESVYAGLAFVFGLVVGAALLKWESS